LPLNEDDWSKLTQTLEAFAVAWDASSYPPSIVEFLLHDDAGMRRELVPELIKLDLEHRWQRGLRKLVEDYADDVPDLAAIVTVDLVFEEYQIRRNAGDQVSPTEIFRRFPALARELDGLFRLDPALRSTFMSGEGPAATIDLSPGETIEDFELLLRLGRGAFATVFLARQKSMQRLVALKVSADKGTEPQTLAQLDHENIIRVYDQRLLPERSVRLLYMQYAAGGTLAEVIHRTKAVPQSDWNGQSYLRAIDAELDDHGEARPTDSAIRRQIVEMSWPQLVCWMGNQLARALHYAHRAGVLHRDIKPANVLITSEGVPKLADFNISFGATLAGASADESMGGSLAYMSPEHLEACNPSHPLTASEMDGRSDLFSLGIVLCELLTGRRPFDEGGHPAPRLLRLETMTVGRRTGLTDSYLRSLCMTEDCGLGDVFKRCLAPFPEQRFASGMALANALELCQQPEARQLLCDEVTWWKQVVRRWPLTSIIAMTVIPNVIGAIFNFLYNRGEIQTSMPTADSTFMRIMLIINLITFPTGILSAGWLVGSVTRATKTDEQARLSAAELQERRRRCLQLGNVAAIVGLTLWLIAAPAYPILLHLIRGDVPATIYAHFVASLTLCGLIAAAYPFFGVSLLAVRCLYPSLVQWETMSKEELPALKRLARNLWIHLILAASVPMISVMILALSGLDRRFALVALAAGGTIGFATAVSAFRLVQQDLQVLIRFIERSAR
jgi:serine/threonine protein kinase